MTSKAWSARVEWPAQDPSDDALAAVAESVHPHHGSVRSDSAAGVISITISIFAPTLRQAVDAALAAARQAALAADLRCTPTRVEVMPEEVFHAEIQHPRVPDLVGYSEIAAMAGVSRQRAREFPDLPDFPPAIAEPSTGPLRVRAQVAAWLATRSRTPGRRPRAAPTTAAADGQTPTELDRKQSTSAAAPSSTRPAAEAPAV